MIAGSARGRGLKGPPGRARRDASDVRPSSDLVRGALFDALSALGADFTRTLDLYAGTGALGIEALSRGGESCCFVEKDRAMAAVIRENLTATGFSDAAEVIVAPVELAQHGFPQRSWISPVWTRKTPWSSTLGRANRSLTPRQSSIPAKNTRRYYPKYNRFGQDN